MSEDFDGCARDCRKAGEHTLKWGRCEHAEEPPREPPKFGWWRTVDGGDGFLSLVRANLPLVAVLPWASGLSVDEQHRMLEEAADGDDPAGVIARWKRVADSRRAVQIAPARPVITGAPPPTGQGFGPGVAEAAYELGRRQGRHDMGG